MLVFLIGFMGAGKTTLGTHYTRVHGGRFIDLDDWLVAQAGMSISDIFAKEGEAGFRRRERQALESLEAFRDTATLVACGGGTPCFGDNMKWMRQHGQTVYLSLSPATLHQRLKHEQAQRPLIRDLSHNQLRTFVEELLEKRNPYYQQASIILNEGQISVKGLHRAINSLRPGSPSAQSSN